MTSHLICHDKYFKTSLFPYFSGKVLDENQLTVRKRAPRPADATANLSSNTQGQDIRRKWSEPLFNRLRDKLQRIRRKRASSEPISLEAIRQRKFSLQNPAIFQVGKPTKFLKKGSSVDSGMNADRTVSPPSLPTEVFSHQDRVTSENKTIVKHVSAEALSSSPSSEECKSTDESRSIPSPGKIENHRDLLGNGFKSRWSTIFMLPLGKQGWYSDESTRFPPLLPWFQNRRSHPCSERNFTDTLVFNHFKILTFLDSNSTRNDNKKP